MRLSRSMLFVPASRPDMMVKATHSTADAICLDLEDAVAPDQKEASRQHIIHALNTIDFGYRTKMVRINGLDTSFAYRDLIEVVEAAGQNLDLIMLPKTSSADDVRFVDKLLSQIESRMGFSKPIGIEAQIETANGFVWMREIAQSTPRLEALIFGMGDYAASMQMPLTNIGETDEHDVLYNGHRWHSVMHQIVATARTFGLRCMDGPFANFKNPDGLKHAAQIAFALGFDGKQCIHPTQLETVNAQFSPSHESIEHARKIVSAYQEAIQLGKGAIAVDGKMVDAANLRMAQSTLTKQQLIASQKI